MKEEIEDQLVTHGRASFYGGLSDKSRWSVTLPGETARELTQCCKSMPGQKGNRGLKVEGT